jgi:serine/threonine-protein kinase
MPYVEGESLRSRLLREKQLPLDETLRIVREAALALDYAHQHGVIHRDIKPENLLLTRDGSTLVADFGIARALLGGEAEGRTGGQTLTDTGLAIGTPAYMSPEQASGERQLDARTDIYALGSVLYEMLAGEAPYTGPTVQAVIAQRFKGEPPSVRRLRPNVPEAVDQAIRKALALVPADRYATAAEFARAIAAGTGSATSAAPAAVPAAPRRSFLHLLATRPLFATLIIGFALGLGLLFAWARNRHAGETAGPKLIAVLPFENLGDSADEYFADGITDEVRGKLATLPGLQVIAGSSAGEYKHSTKSPRQIAQELGVQYLLIGKIRWEKSGAGQNRVRVSPELVQITSGSAPTTKWQQPFDASLTDVFQVQADIAGRVAQALDLALGSSAQQQLAEKPTRNLAAYDAYLKGVEAASLGNNPVTVRQALGHLEQAVALDTSFAAAWGRLSQAASLLNGLSTPSPELKTQARTAADRALALAPDRPESHVALGDYYRRIDNDYERALREYTEGHRLAPSNADLLRGTALAEEALGRWEPALHHLEEAQRLDPRSALTANTLTGALHYMRRYPEALRAADRALDLAPGNLSNFEAKVMIHLSQGDLAGARAVLQTPPKGVEPTAVVAYIATYYDLFWLLSDEQRAVLVRLPPGQFDDDRGAWGLALAGAYAVRGDKARARAYADSARIALEGQLHETPGDAGLHVYYGTALAYLGHKQEAIDEGRKGVAIQPVSKDEANGTYLQHQLAWIYILVGEYDKALDQLEPLLRIPYYLSPGWLRVDPTFDPLRNNPRFQKLVAAGA